MQNELHLYVKVTLQVYALHDEERKRLHFVVKQHHEPDFERFSRAMTIAQSQQKRLPQHFCN